MKIDLDVGGTRARIAGIAAAAIMGLLMYAYRPEQKLAVTLGPAAMGLVVFAFWQWPPWQPIRQRVGGLVAAIPVAWAVAVTGGADSPFAALFVPILVYEAMVRFTPWFILDAGAAAAGIMLPAFYDPGPQVALRLAILLLAAAGAAAFARVLVLEADAQAEELTEYEARFRTLAEDLDGVVYWLRLSPEIELQYINPAIERITGFSRQEFYDDPDLLIDRVREEDAAAILRSMTTDPQQAAAGQSTYRFQRPDGSFVWIEDHFVPHRDRSGAVIALQGMMFDISAKVEASDARDRSLAYERRAAAHLRGTVELQQAFLQSVSHELRTPLTTVVGVAQLLQSGRIDPHSQDFTSLLDRLYVQAEILHRKISDIGEVAGISDDRDLVMETIDLSRVVLDGTARFDSHDHRLHLDVEPTLLVTGNRGELERLVRILLDNAARHTPAGASIWIRLEQQNHLVALTVDDNGPGVPEELHSIIFQAFRQGRDATERPSPGTGIGLALAQRTAVLHRGSIHCTDSPTGGARFVVQLPSAIA